MISEILTKDFYKKIWPIIINPRDVFVHFYVQGFLQTTYDWEIFKTKRLKKSRKKGYYENTVFHGGQEFVWYKKGQGIREIWNNASIENNGTIHYIEKDPKTGITSEHLGTLYITLPDWYSELFYDLLDSKTMLPEIFHGEIKITSSKKYKSIVI